MGKSIRKYSIDGRFGRVEYSELEQQNGCDTTYNYEDFDQDTGNLYESKEFISNLPPNISKDDYFKMALLDSIKNIKEDKNNYSTERSLAVIAQELHALNGNLNKLIQIQVADNKSK